MVIEASHITSSPLIDITGIKHGKIDRCIYSGEQGRLIGFQVAQNGVVTKFRALDLADCVAINQGSVVIDSPDALQKDLKMFDEIVKKDGSIINVPAATESGTKLGRVTDLLLDADTGVIVRFYIRALLGERIIPREFVVAITPKQVVFKDVVNTPVFTQIATTSEAGA